MHHSTAALSRTVLSILTVAIASLLFASTAVAQTPVEVPVQGLLTDTDGTALDGDVQATFRIYEDSSSTDALWESTIDTTVDQGLFEVYLGATEELDADIFHAYPSAMLSIQIDGDEESPRMKLGAVPTAAHAVTATTADDAQTLQGQTPDDLTQAETAGETPFDDSQAQLGTDNTQDALEALLQRVEALEQTNQDLESRVSSLESVNVQNLEGRVSANETDISDLDSRVATNETNITSNGNDISSLQSTVSNNSSAISTNSSNISTNSSNISSLQSTVSDHATDISNNAADIGTNSSDISSLQSTVSGNTSSISALETKTASMSATTINGKAAVTFDGVNLHVRSGSGSTEGAVNGVGNLIVGYDEQATTSDKSGSHNLILGERNNYSSYGGFIGGSGNSIEADYASILSGSSNTASGSESVVVTGSGNGATDVTSVVVTGFYNEATGRRAGVLSGWYNIASGSYSGVLSGDSNDASAARSSVGGGNNQVNTTTETFLATGTVN